MAEAPPTRYAKTPDGAHIAYQVAGDGPFDLLFVPGWISHVDLWWENPDTAHFFSRLASFSRLILYDKPGTGASDRDAPSMTVDERMDDVQTVMKAAGSSRAALFGISEGGPMAALFAATHPERTIALVVFGSTSGLQPEPDQPERQTHRDHLEAIREIAATSWGEGETLRFFQSRLAADPRHRAAFGRVERMCGNPSSVSALIDLVFAIDVRDALGAIRVPALVAHRTDDHAIPVECGRDLARRIPGARYFEQPGEHLPWYDDADGLLDEVQEFLTGVRPVYETDRVLTTVLFTDIVGSTEQAAALGDRRWKELLERHDQMMASLVARFRGRSVKNTGDGVLATFDGPTRGVRCAVEALAGARELGLTLRVGLHTGEVELRQDDVGGIAVHIAARVNSLARPGEVLVTRTVKDLVAGAGIRLDDRGVHALKGVPDEWQLYAAQV